MLRARINKELIARLRLVAALSLAGAAIILGGCSASRHQEVVWSRDNALRAPRECSVNELGSRYELSESLAQSIRYFEKQPPGGEYTFGSVRYTASELLQGYRALHEAALAPDSQAIIEKLAREMVCFESAAPAVKVTGYYEGQLNASPERSDRFQHAIYSRPKDILTVDLKSFLGEKRPPSVPASLTARLEGSKVVPYYSREEIDYGGALSGKGLELYWVDDPLALFFLHIQGSAVLRLSDGTLARVGYAGANGREYRAIGTLLLREGTLNRSEVSMQGIVGYLRSNPHDVRRVLSYNPSYVFFEERRVGPIGSTGAIVSPYRSIATDLSLFPRGALAHLETTIILPSGENADFSALVMNHDSGGAIKGPGRVDLFTGRGLEAEQVAGRLNSPGKLTFIAPRKSRK